MSFANPIKTYIKQKKTYKNHPRGRFQCPAGYLKAVWLKIVGPVFLDFRPEIDPGTPRDRRGLPGTSICTKNQPGRPILMPFRGSQKLPQDCLQVPRSRPTCCLKCCVFCCCMVDVNLGEVALHTTHRTSFTGDAPCTEDDLKSDASVQHPCLPRARNSAEAILQRL